MKDKINDWLGVDFKKYGLLALLLGLGALYFSLIRPEIAGFWYDDGIYLLGAKALATGHGYHLLSEPGSPAIVKYPPMLSLILAPLWWLNPNFSANLSLFKTLNIGLGLGALVLVYRLARQYRFGVWTALFLVLAMGLHPAWLSLVTDVMSEPLYLLITMALMLLTTRIHQRETTPTMREGIACIMLSVAAFYTRSIGITAIMGLTFWLWRQWGVKLASRYLLASGGLCAIWWVWTAQQPPAIVELGNFYAASYNQTYFSEMMLEIIKAQGINSILWDNVTLLPSALLETLLPGLQAAFQLAPIMPALTLIYVSGLCVLGIKRYRKHFSPVAAYACCYLLACLLWYAHDQYARLILPILPLLWIGLFGALNNLLRKWIGQPKPRQIVQIALALALLFSLQPQRILNLPHGNTLASNAGAALWEDYQATFAAIPQFSQPNDIFWGRYSSLYPLYTQRLVISRNIIPSAKAYGSGELQDTPDALWHIFAPILNHEKVRYIILEPHIMGRQMVETVDEATLRLIQAAPQHFTKHFTSPHGYIVIYRYNP